MRQSSAVRRHTRFRQIAWLGPARHRPRYKHLIFIDVTISNYKDRHDVSIVSNHPVGFKFLCLEEQLEDWINTLFSSPYYFETFLVCCVETWEWPENYVDNLVFAGLWKRPLRYVYIIYWLKSWRSLFECRSDAKIYSWHLTRVIRRARRSNRLISL